MATGAVKKVLVSACLLGERVRYNGEDRAVRSEQLEALRAEGRVVSFCPEVAGGLGVPRPRAELSADRQVHDEHGVDVTAAFERGAALAVEAAIREGVVLAILKEGSPSCGSTEIGDGTFTSRRIPGEGITARLLRARGIRVFDETKIDRALEWLRSQEG